MAPSSWPTCWEGTCFVRAAWTVAPPSPPMAVSMPAKTKTPSWRASIAKRDGTNGSTPASRRSNGARRRTRSSCTSPSSCRPSGAPLPPSSAAPPTSASSATRSSSTRPRPARPAAWA
ncbi:hypothetical protein BN1708_018203 [Verticillium longisporum]|uniref:Uncharacterized protein n=1 Tax=Verticillium longisporum TaxID=100787 RepID=A0A0G4LWH1_VERLO|nr:hypothetical protein BN1708_018203 [Verticillium longisporum]